MIRPTGSGTRFSEEGPRLPPGLPTLRSRPAFAGGRRQGRGHETGAALETVARLLAEHGADVPLPALARIVAAPCPRLAPSASI